MFKKFKHLLALPLVCAGFGMAAQAAQADSYQPFGNNIPCYLYAYSPYSQAGGAVAQAYVYCGSNSQWNWSNSFKQIAVQLMDLTPYGWQVVANTGWSGYTQQAFDGLGVGSAPCVSGRWYATRAQAGAIYGTLPEQYASTNTYGSGFRCP